MKKKYFVIVALIIFLGIPIVNADCSNEEIELLKKEANKIKVTYEHMGKVETYDGPTYNRFNVEITNIPDNFYIKIYDDTKYTPENGTVTKELLYGKWQIKVYSEKCEKEIDTISFKLPKFNMYSLDPLCKGIDGNDFPLCGKYYEYDVSYDSFKQRVEHYRITHKIEDNTDEPKEEKNNFDIILKYLNEYKVYISIGLGTILVITLIIILIKKKRNRGVLK